MKITIQADDMAGVDRAMRCVKQTMEKEPALNRPRHRDCILWTGERGDGFVCTVWGTPGHVRADARTREGAAA